ncbi:redox-sensing transcriptional repressor Rex [Thermanaerothrix sp.]|jgi:redox-sensing transcriptional repressor|uniref:redox-sensing transcriptional repressor Rex n=1 Tax=Thermanaerothrix sp. TaxID=2972675 RepID=UPI002ADE1E7A|nr:redox-sensing transcriptional repressor Rex [Thermanaerothrix sp.]
MAEQSVPDIVIGRLPRYLQALERMRLEGITTTSSLELGQRLGISAAQIRKDLSHFGEFGKQGTGYSVEFLIEQLRAILNLNRMWDLALVGVGDLGSALARYQGFTNRGFRIVLAFDNDPQKIGKRIGHLVIEDSATIPERIRQTGVKIAMLTVPAAEAQKVTDCLVEAGIRAILNYAPIHLVVPPGIIVEHIDPILKLQHMTYYLD